MKQCLYIFETLDFAHKHATVNVFKQSINASLFPHVLQIVLALAQFGRNDPSKEKKKNIQEVLLRLRVCCLIR